MYGTIHWSSVTIPTCKAAYNEANNMHMLLAIMIWCLARHRANWTTSNLFYRVRDISQNIRVGTLTTINNHVSDWLCFHKHCCDSLIQHMYFVKILYLGMPEYLNNKLISNTVFCERFQQYMIKSIITLISVTPSENQRNLRGYQQTGRSTRE